MTPLERAARALCDLASEDADEMLTMSDGSSMPRWRYEERKVRAVLEAIREPDQMMLDAAADAEAIEQGDGWVHVRYGDLFEAMIDAALEEGE